MVSNDMSLYEGIILLYHYKAVLWVIFLMRVKYKLHQLLYKISPSMTEVSRH